MISAQKISGRINQMFAAFGRGDVAGFTAFMAEDFEYLEAGGETHVVGKDAFKEFIAGWMGISSKHSITPVRKLISDEGVAVELHYEGVLDKGELYGFKPQGQRISFDYVAWYELSEDGQFSQLKAFADKETILQQLAEGE